MLRGILFAVVAAVTLAGCGSTAAPATPDRASPAPDSPAPDSPAPANPAPASPAQADPTQALAGDSQTTSAPAGSAASSGTCPDPVALTAEQLATLLIVPGISASSGWPDWLPAGAGGVFLGSTSGSAGLADGGFGSRPGTLLPFVAVDYEGGLVSGQSGFIGSAPSPREQAATMSTDEVRALAADRGGAMRAGGVTVDFAPVVDLDLGSPVIGSRSYGADPATVVRYAGAFSDGLHDAGVVPVLKHFPGHGSTDSDSHKALSTTDSWEVVQQRDVPLYRELLARPRPWMVMMGHLVVPGLSADADTVTSVDPAAYRALRQTTGFVGPVITDDLVNMKAVADRMTSVDAVVASISAGADLALMTEAQDYGDAVAALVAWDQSDPAHHAQLTASATRALSVLPCATTR